MDAIILCGGLGTRLAPVVSTLPKSLAPVAGRPFLDYLLAWLRSTGIVDRVILATGHLAGSIDQHYGADFEGLPLCFSREEHPLGTGGALLLALARHGSGRPVLVLNGDSFVDADLPALARQLDAGAYDLVMTAFAVDDAARFGTLTLSGDRVTAFHEKRGIPTPGHINAGIYAARPEAFDAWAGHPGPLSLEQVVLPALVAAGRVGALCSGTRFIDIGLPETYAAAAAFFHPR